MSAEDRSDRPGAGDGDVLFSVVIPTFARPDLLSRLLDRLLPQVRRAADREIVVVNDASHDARYEEVVSRAADGIAYIVLEQNGGPAIARNAGAARAQGRFLVFTDDDCVVPVDWLDTLQAIVDADPHAAAVAGRALPLPLRNGAGMLDAYLAARAQANPGPHLDRGRLVCMPTNTLAVRRDWFDRVGGFDDFFTVDGVGRSAMTGSEDTSLTLRLKAAGAPIRYRPQWFVLHDLGLGWRTFLNRYYRYGIGSGLLRRRLGEHQSAGEEAISPPGERSGHPGAFIRAVRRAPAVAGRTGAEFWRNSALQGVADAAWALGERKARRMAGSDLRPGQSGTGTGGPVRRSQAADGFRVAMVAPLNEPVPPRLSGGVNRVVACLCDGLAEAGHAVNLWASGDSRTGAVLHPVIRKADRRASRLEHLASLYQKSVDEICARPDSFDILHLHWFGQPLSVPDPVADRCVITLHWRADQPRVAGRLEGAGSSRLVCLSQAHAAPLGGPANVDIVPNGIDADLYNPVPHPDDYLVYIGRLSEEKRPDRAVRLARLTGRQLRIAGNFDREDRTYVETRLQHMISSDLVTVLGEIDDAGKQEQLANAGALVLPLDWPEPFGLVMAEAMACGTPVIAFDRGAVREVVEHGVTGFVVRNMQEAALAVARLPELDRTVIRRRFEQRFTSRAMVENYLRLYRDMTETGMLP